MDENTGLRRALKNPLVMVGLCIFAGIVVYHNVIESNMDSSLPISVASISSPADPSPITSTSSQMMHDEVASQWVENPVRDPFTPMSGTTSSKTLLKQSTASASVTQRQQVPSPNRLMLKAVAIEAQRRSAVINRQVVYEGEIIEGYQVVSIQLKGVWLQRHGKKEFLTFAVNTTS